jgi:hypothetical protein
VVRTGVGFAKECVSFISGRIFVFGHLFFGITAIRCVCLLLPVVISIRLRRGRQLLKLRYFVHVRVQIAKRLG